MPHHKSEYRAFVPDLLGGGGGNRDRLRVHHFAHHSTRTVSRAHEHRIDPELLRSDSLQTPEQRVRRSVTSSQRNSEPAEKGAEERICPARSSEGEAQDRIQPRIACHVTQSEHEGNRDHRQSHAHQSAPESFRQSTRAHAEQQSGQDRCEEASSAGCGKPVEVIPRCLRGRLGDHRSRAIDRVVQKRDIPAGWAGPDFSVREHDLESRRGGLIYGQLDLRQTPEKDEE